MSVDVWRHVDHSSSKARPGQAGFGEEAQQQRGLVLQPFQPVSGRLADLVEGAGGGQVHHGGALELGPRSLGRVQLRGVGPQQHHAHPASVLPQERGYLRLPVNVHLIPDQHQLALSGSCACGAASKSRAAAQPMPSARHHRAKPGPGRTAVVASPAGSRPSRPNSPGRCRPDRGTPPASAHADPTSDHVIAPPESHMRR